MGSADFFIDKAKEYTNTIDQLLLNLARHAGHGTIYSHTGKERSGEIPAIRIKIKQLFAGSGMNGIFERNIAAIDNNRMIGSEEEEVLERYKYVLSLFVHHMAGQEARLETP